MIHAFTFVLILMPVVALVYWFLLAPAAIGGEFRPSIHDRVDEILRPHEGVPVSEATLEELERRVDAAVRDVLVDLHQEPGDLIVRVKNDEVLGPVCRIQLGDGPEMSLADYERSIRG